jgi:5'-3' exoribonuclease 2
MGVPAFFKWLTGKYGKILENENIEKRRNHNYDNLYIDMNGLIHPCSHPEDQPPPSSEDEMFTNISKYVDRIFEAVQPQHLLFLAMDGVAPRAKMNQQRMRRFRSVQDKREKTEITEQVIAEMYPELIGREIEVAWDSNVITPGTHFMHRLSAYLKGYIADRMTTNPLWKNITVIFSDSSEYGEGEHKIMRFIRSQRTQPGYDSNRHHILHGLDADLIMLALATHEPNFTILREIDTSIHTRKGGKGRDKDVKRESHRSKDSIGETNLKDSWLYAKQLGCLEIWVLREYLESEFEFLQETLAENFDFERIVDDFVFLCFFVGNDFLPHLPTLDIRENAIEFLLTIYKELRPGMDDYITGPGGEIHFDKVIN